VTQAPILGVPKVDGGPCILTTDASLLGIGCCLAQQQGDKEVTLSFWSKSLNAAQRNYCITHLELLAVVTGIKAHHHHFLIGAPFILRTDHSALQWFKSFKNLRGRLARWMEQLEMYKFEIQHVPASAIPHVDFLSRRPNRPCNPECSHCNRTEMKENLIESDNVQVSWTTLSPDDGLSSSEIATEQRKDEDLKPIISALETTRIRPQFQEISRFNQTEPYGINFHP